MPDNNLTRQKLQQLLASARLNRADIDPNGNAPKYNWNQCHYFDKNQIKTIVTMARSIGTAFGSALNSLGRSDCTAAAGDITQHFASDILSEFSSQPQFNTALINEQNNSCGFISVSAISARSLIAKLLGDSEPQSGSQALSGLENSLLQDIAAALVNTLSRSIKQAGGPLLRRAADIAEGNPVIDCPPNKELCRTSFKINMQDATAVFNVVIIASVLDPMITKTQTAAAASNQSQEIILTHIKPVPLPINTRLACASLRLNDVLALEEGDVIVLDKQITEPIEILLRDTPVFAAHLAAEAGNYALVIAEPSPETTC